MKAKTKTKAQIEAAMDKVQAARKQLEDERQKFYGGHRGPWTTADQERSENYAADWMRYAGILSALAWVNNEFDRDAERLARRVHVKPEPEVKDGE